MRRRRRLSNYTAAPVSEPRPSMQKWKFSYNSITDYLTEVTKNESPVMYRSSRSRGADGNFRILDSFEDALNLANRGWMEGANQAKQYSAKINALLGSVGKSKDWRFEVYGGGSLDVQRYINGRPDCYRHLKRAEREHKFVTVVFNASAVQSVSASVMIRKGVLGTAMIDALELNGYRVKVVLACCQTYGDNSLETYVTLKDFQDSLDLDRLVFFTAHPDAYRRINFSFRETRSAEIVSGINIGQTYGCSSDATERGDVYIGRSWGSETQWQTEEATVEYLKNTLKEQFQIEID